MVRKKVDERVRTLIENCTKTKHRSFFVLVGDHGKDQVANLHYILTKSQVKSRPSVLWCYKKELGFSTHKQKRMRQIKKQMQRGLYDANKEDPFELFIASTDIRWCYYKETQKILGSTYGMCVLQDFEAITPNIMARTIETVEGGGIVVLLLRTMSSLKKLYTMTMDVHSRFRTESHADVVPRFNERFLLSLSSCDKCVVLDDELNVLPISKHVRSIQPIATADSEASMSTTNQELVDLKESLKDSMPVGALVEQAKTIDQAKAILTFVEAISEKSLKSTVALTAARGRGKSAALGISLSAAVAYGYSNIFVTSPSPENLKTVFDFIFKGFDALSYKEHVDYEVIQSTNPDFNKAVVRVNIFREHRQTIQYIQPSDAEKLSQAELLAIDEAAAIPLPLVKKLLGPYLVFMSSTINGYEGTGRSLSLKLLQDLRKAQGSAAVAAANAASNIKGDGKMKSKRKVHEERWEAARNAANDVLQNSSSSSGRVLREVSLETPIRYSTNDSVEKWLNNLLCLDVQGNASRIVSGTPHPSTCELYSINRDSLFSYHKLSEAFLQRIMALYVSSHYKNQPNDLQLLSDAPAHQLFVLLGPQAEGQGNAGQLPDILCVVQVALEGDISKKSVNSQLSRGQRASGDLIPWTIAQQFQDAEFAGLSGARVVRIATHPDVTSMGYGSRAIECLTKYYQGGFVDISEAAPVVEEPVKEEEQEETTTTLTKEKIKPRKKLEPLLVPLSECQPVRLHWFGTSFGLTQPLYNFWQRGGFSSVYVRQTANSLTGEHTSIMLRSLNHEDIESTDEKTTWLAEFSGDAKRRFVSLLSYEFRNLSVTLAMGLLFDEGSDQAKKKSASSLERTQTGEISADELLSNLTPFDMKRLDSYSKNMVDYHMIVDLLPTITRLFFLQRFPELKLSYLQRAILLGIGCQHKSVDVLQQELNIPSNQLLALFNKAVRKFTAQFQQIMEAKAEGELETKSSMKKIIATEISSKKMKPTSVSLEQEQEDGKKEAIQMLEKKQKELLGGLSEYAIQGTDSEWQEALSSHQAGSVAIKNSKKSSKKHSMDQPEEEASAKKHKKNKKKKSKYANVKK